MSELPTSILVVDDDDRFRERVARAFDERGFAVAQAAGVAQALELAAQDSPELAVVDLRMPDGSGLDVVRGLLEIDPATRVVVLTGYGSIATAVEAVRSGALDYLSKPADVDEILARFARHEAGEATRETGDAEAEAEPYPVASLARVEWEHIQRILHDCDGNVSKAARMLGLHRRSLQRKLAKDPVSH